MINSLVTTRAGVVRGAEIADGVLAWRGIPYAAAPVGELRWKPSLPAEPWAGVRDVLSYGPPAVQPSFEVPGNPPLAPGAVAPQEIPEPAEDCLNLNVTAPADAENRPVIVWVHGGGYHVGNGTQGPGDGARFARAHQVVVVSFNYRLGALGFLSVPGEEHTGAYGLHDQIAALRWVRQNIAAFGGDPARVTICGVSAGAKSVANLLASPLTRDLFGRAVSFSGGADHIADAEQNADLQQRYLKELGVSEPTTALLRSVPAADLLAAQNAIAEGMRATWIWRPSIDGLALDRPPLAAIAEGSARGIDLLVQHCLLECLLYHVMYPGAADEADHVLTSLFGGDGAAAIISGYTAARPDIAADPHRMRVEIFSDERYGVPSLRLADAQSRHASVWRSRFDGPLSGVPIPGVPAVPLPAVHGSDMVGAWHGFGPAGAELFATLGAFATTGRPHTEALPGWPGYDDKDRPTMVFADDGAHLELDPQAAQHQVWDGLTWPSGTWWSIDRPEA